MARPRFFVQELPGSGSVQLGKEESKHAKSVLRLKRDDVGILFDGQGGEAQCHIVECVGSTTVVEIIERLDTDRELPFELNLYVALPKGDRQRTLVDGLAELGVTSLTPLISERSVALPNEKTTLRLQRAVVETSKQCGRNRLMRIGQPMNVAELAACSSLDGNRYLAHPIPGQTPRDCWEQRCNDAAGNDAAGNDAPIHVAIGPEGGFTDSEVQQLQDGHWQVVHLGARLLRVEIAALSLAAFFSMQNPSMPSRED